MSDIRGKFENIRILLIFKEKSRRCFSNSMDLNLKNIPNIHHWFETIPIPTFTSKK